jgi:hypothetical protein
MKAAFPDYDYADMVDAQYPLLHEGLGIKPAAGDRQFDGRRQLQELLQSAPQRPT